MLKILNSFIRLIKICFDLQHYQSDCRQIHQKLIGHGFITFMSNCIQSNFENSLPRKSPLNLVIVSYKRLNSNFIFNLILFF